jgi:hypothetical protein
MLRLCMLPEDSASIEKRRFGGGFEEGGGAKTIGEGPLFTLSALGPMNGSHRARSVTPMLHINPSDETLTSGP